jgi:glycosyltransferase involved in cell wall biosynthesis
VKILLFHQHFNTPKTGGALRSYYLATGLVQRSHRVIVITAHAKPSRLETNVDGVEVVYLPVPYNNRFSFYARARSFGWFVLRACLTGGRYRDADRCYAISAPLTVGLCGLWMRWRFKMPYWFEVGDLWPDAPIELGYIRNPLLKSLFLRMERWIYAKAEAVVALSEPIEAAIRRKAPGTRIEQMPNMSDCEYFQPGPRQLALEERVEPRGKKVVAYLGAMGAANGLSHVLKCAGASQKADLPIRFVLGGDGAMIDDLKNEAVEMKLTNVTFAGFLNREEVRDVLNVADAVFVSYRPAKILETGCPNKYFDGLAAGKLVIVNFGGWIRQEVESNKCGLFVDPKAPEEFVTKIRRYLSDQGLWEEAGRNSRRLAERQYSRKMLSDRLASFFTS